MDVRRPAAGCHPEIELFIDNLLVRIYFIIVMSRWTGLAPGSSNSLSQVALHLPSQAAEKTLSRKAGGSESIKESTRVEAGSYLRLIDLCIAQL